MQASGQVRPGDVVAGKYRVERILGEGGMGYVLGARNITLDEPIAIKILKPDAVKDAEAVARFFREARASVRMKGEHVAKVLDVGALENGTPFMLMELLEGSDLATVVERSGWLQTQVAVDYVLQICEALAEAHALGIVHRDIKPSNLFLTTGIDGMPCVKVLDFGISKATNAIDATRPDFGLTQTQTIMGSPQYMAPEQMRSSRRVDGRTDIWGLGTIMHELLTGEPPFVASSMPELFAMILQDPAPSLRVRRPDIPPGLDAVVLQCLEKSPERRPPNVFELAQLLMPFAGPMSAGAAERVGRVGRSVAFASASLIAATQELRDSARSFATPPVIMAAQAGAGAVSALGSSPSGPEMSHVNTTRVPSSRPRRRTRVIVLAAAISMGAVGTGLIAAVAVARNAKSRAATAVSATSAAAEQIPVDMPPAIDPLPPATYHAPDEPAAASSASVSSASAPAPTTAAAAPPGAKRANASDAGARTASASAPVSSAAAASPASSSAPRPAPATTASSRFD